VTLARTMRVLALGSAVTASGCSSTVFACSEDADCNAGGRAGICQPEGYCSFPDDSCDSGQRFGEHAGSGLAGMCVVPEAADGTTAIHTTSTSGDPAGTDASKSTGSFDDTGSPAETSSGTDCEAWWNCAWSRRRHLGIAMGPSGQGDLVDVPVLVLLTPQRIDYDAARADAADLRFVAADESTLLPYEIERWQPGGTSVVWVKVPSIAPGENAGHFTMYYGSSDASSQEDPAEVWSNGYLAVWHLDDLQDALGNRALESTGTQVVDGRIGGARLFDGSSTRMVVAGDPLPDLFEGGATISAWIRPDGWGGSSFGRIIESCSGALTQEGWSFSVANPPESPTAIRFAHDFVDERGEWRTGRGSMTLGQWHLVAVAYSTAASTDPRFTIQGATAAFDTYFSPAGAPVQSSTSPTTIGAQGSAELRFFDGIIDELRISTVVRSEAWLELQYRSMSDELLVYGDEERVSEP
jgi:hypothetical protein